MVPACTVKVPAKCSGCPVTASVLWATNVVNQVEQPTTTKNNNKEKHQQQKPFVLFCATKTKTGAARSFVRWLPSLTTKTEQSHILLFPWWTKPINTSETYFRSGERVGVSVCTRVGVKERDKEREWEEREWKQSFYFRSSSSPLKVCLHGQFGANDFARCCKMSVKHFSKRAALSWPTFYSFHAARTKSKMREIAKLKLKFFGENGTKKERKKERKGASGIHRMHFWVDLTTFNDFFVVSTRRRRSIRKKQLLAPPASQPFNKKLAT